VRSGLADRRDRAKQPLVAQGVLARTRPTERYGGSIPGTDYDRYWSVDIPGLTELEAHRLLRWVETESVGWHAKGTALDPRVFLTLHLDRASVQMLYDDMMRSPVRSAPGIAEELEGWLASTADED
jgi:hypothetical protein